MKNILIVLALIFSFNLYAQDPILQKDHPQLEEKAFEITEKYNAELALDGEQVTLFQKKVEEFLIRRQEIEDKLEGKTKLNALLAMQSRETAEMNDILTRPQLAVYKRIKHQIQPLDTVEKKEKKNKDKM